MTISDLKDDDDILIVHKQKPHTELLLRERKKVRKKFAQIDFFPLFPHTRARTHTQHTIYTAITMLEIA